MPAGEVAQIAKTLTTETINLTESDVALDTNVLLDTDTYSVASGVITVKEDGSYLLINHLAADRQLGTNRSAAETFIHVNSTLVSGAYSDCFIRRSASVDADSSTGVGIYDLTTNDTVKMRKLRINGAGSDCRLLGSQITAPLPDIPQRSCLTLIKLNDNNPVLILEATTADNVALTADDTDADMNWTTQTKIDTGYTHTSGNAAVTLDEIGFYLVVWSNSWSRATDSAVRTGVYERLQLDNTGGGGFVDVPGTYCNNYIRGSQNGEQILRGNNSAAAIIETTSVDEIIKLVSAREAGAITCDRLPLKSRLCIYKLGDGEQKFMTSDTTTQNIGSTTPIVYSYDTTDHEDANFTHNAATDLVTVANAGRYLAIQGSHTDTTATTARTAPLGGVQFNSVTNPYGSGGGYNRSSGSMQRVSTPFTVVGTLSASQSMRIGGFSTAASDTTTNRTAAASGFYGIDLATMAPVGSPWHYYAQQRRG